MRLKTLTKLYADRNNLVVIRINLVLFGILIFCVFYAQKKRNSPPCIQIRYRNGVNNAKKQLVFWREFTGSNNLKSDFGRCAQSCPINQCIQQQSIGSSGRPPKVWLPRKQDNLTLAHFFPCQVGRICYAMCSFRP